MGVRLAFDDFGTGYAMLANLVQLPLSRLKIDRSFVKNITEHSSEAAIIRSIVNLAPNLGLTVTAEGIETDAQVNFLVAEGCEEGQGFLYAKPVVAREFFDYCKNSSDPILRHDHVRTG